MYRRKNKNLIAIVVSIVLIFAVIAIAYSKINERFDSMETSTKYTKANYAVGSISTTNGKIIESNEHIYTTKMSKISDATIKLSEDATITYKVFYYDEDKAFVSASDSLDMDYATALTTVKTAASGTTAATYKASTPATAVYFRVLITPAQVDGENVNLATTDISRYINQISIVVAK